MRLIRRPSSTSILPESTITVLLTSIIEIKVATYSANRWKHFLPQVSGFSGIRNSGLPGLLILASVTVFRQSSLQSESALRKMTTGSETNSALTESYLALTQFHRNASSPSIIICSTPSKRSLVSSKTSNPPQQKHPRLPHLQCGQSRGFLLSIRQSSCAPDCRNTAS